MLREYGANEVRADASYRGQVIQTTGYVESLGRDMLDSIYVVLTSTRGSDPTSLQYNFGEAELQQVANVSRGKHITVRGRVAGLSLGSVIVSNCEIVGQ
ncbi:OB-fold protein [Corallococcus sicarius]|uniref:OB-fold protein n=1 Tax=Corallococcus sicarius TaxID=2316726 RepID=UPI0013159081|nr:hypothetical protein [Corallococcus sicarius]